MLVTILFIVVIFLLGVNICFLGHIWDTLEDILTALNIVRDKTNKEE